MNIQALKPLCEIIVKDEETLEFRLDEEQNVVNYFEKILSGAKRKRTLFLDLHKVTDTLNESELDKLKNLQANKIVVSFVGWTGLIRGVARNQLRDLVDRNIIDIGILVFSRNSKKEIWKKLGSKYWIIQLLMNLVLPDKAIFLDDSLDHVRSVSVIKGIQSLQYTETDSNLLQLIQDFIANIN